MITWEYVLGETKTWRVVPRNTAGTIADLTGATAELRITVSPAICLPIPAAGTDERGFAFTLTAATLDLAPGRYAASIWIGWPDGELRMYARVLLLIRKGC